MENQRKEIRDFCEKSGLTVEHEFLEYTAANAVFKPEFERLKVAIIDREIDKIAVTELCKISRNLNNLLEFIEMLRRNNVELIEPSLCEI